MRNSPSAGAILVSFVCLFCAVGGMYLVNAHRQASLLLPEEQPPAVSAMAQMLHDQVIPSFLALQERAVGAVASLPEPPLSDFSAQKAPASEPAAALPEQTPEQAPEQTLEGAPEPSRSEVDAASSAVEKQSDVVNGVIERGDSAEELLSPYLSASSVQQLLNASRRVHPLSRIRTGQPYTLVRSSDGEAVERFEYEIDERKKLIVSRTEDGFTAHVEPIVYDHALVRVSGTIRSSLFEALASAGESPIIGVRIAEIFGSEINFIKDLHEGDRFALLIEKRFRGEAFKGYGKVLGATFTNRGKTYEAYLFSTEDGESFFNARGESLKKTLLKAPLSFTRISSGYSMNRKHPIFKTEKPHQGVDYAAPSGTPVKAVGDGTVEKAGWGNGYGNTVVLRHSGGLESLYAHLSRFAPTAKVGSRVRQGQIIGYVGATGYATGPHLDFRLKRNGQFINPSRIVAQRDEGISRGRMADFKKQKALVDAYLEGRRDVAEYRWQ